MATPTSNTPSAGIHHVTSMAGLPQANIDFYAGVLGLRLVKVTVNFDDPGTYHLYYGDALGSPGSILTFFAWNDAPRGRVGSGEVVETMLRIPPGSTGAWERRLLARNVAVHRTVRFGAWALTFRDPDGMALGLVERQSANGVGKAIWRGPAADPIDADMAIAAMEGVTLSVAGYEATARVLTEVFGFRQADQEGERFRFVAGSDGASAAGALGATVDVLCQPERARGRLGVGSTHHVAFRAADPEQQRALQAEARQRGLNVTPVVDRTYFESIYFREPGGVLFEVATDGPGFAVDEPADALGKRLMLPRQYEALRPDLLGSLARLKLPGGGVLP